MSKPVILTVDDEPDVLSAIERDLYAHFRTTYRIVKAGSGQEALKVVEELKQRGANIALFMVVERMPSMTGIEFLGQAALPMSLLLTGVSLADAVAEGGLTKRIGNTVAGCVVKMGILPPLIILAAKWLPCSIELKQVLVVQAAMPCAMVPVIVARYYKADTGTAVRIVLASTILGLLTIPLWMRIGAAIVGLEIPGGQ